MRYSQYFGNKIFHLFFVLPFGVWRYCAQITLNIVVELQFFKARKRAKQPGQKIKTRNDIEACWSKLRRGRERKREIIKSDCVTQPKTSCCTVWKCVFVFFGSTSPQYWIFQWFCMHPATFSSLQSCFVWSKRVKMLSSVREKNETEFFFIIFNVQLVFGECNVHFLVHISSISIQ